MKDLKSLKLEDLCNFEDILTKLEDLNLFSLNHRVGELLEERVIQEALRRCNRRKGKAAQLLGIDVKTLYNKTRKKNNNAQNRESVPDVGKKEESNSDSDRKIDLQNVFVAEFEKK